MIFLKDLSWWPLIVFTFLYISLLVFGAIYIRWNFYIRSLHKGKNKRWVSLSFDDGPAAYTEAILNVLKAEGIRATFFTIGKNAAAHPEMVARWHKEGHLIGNHSYYHGFNFDWQSTAAMRLEINACNKIIHEVTGKRTRLFRPPYGVTNPNLARAIRRCGMLSIGWSVRSFDTTARDPEKLLARILRKVQGGDIILLHDSMGITKDILTEMIRILRQKGYSFVPLDKLLDIEPYE